MADQPSAGGQAMNALKLVANVAILPGAGQLLEGNVGEGVVYGAAGVAAKLISPLLGPLFWVPWVAVGLDSFSRSASGKHLWQLSQPSAPPSRSGPGEPTAP
jgi:hypothetical protein